MKAKALLASDETSFALVFEKGDEVMRELTAFAASRRLSAAHFTAIGALSDATLGYFDRAKKEYKKISIREQVEVLSLVGDLALEGSDPKVHAHIVLGKSDGTAHGGHLIVGHVWPVLELVLTVPPAHLRRKSDPETGLALLDACYVSTAMRLSGPSACKNDPLRRRAAVKFPRPSIVR